MRVIAGKFRSRSLRSLRGLDIRPTSDRLRETLFNVLTAGNPEALAGAVWLDLFAGTGAVGIEALSRGARMVYFVEKSRSAAAVIEANLKSLGVNTGFEVVQGAATRAISQLEGRGVSADFVFLDPPYRLKTAYRETLEALANSTIAEHARVMVEHEKHFDPGEQCGSLHRTRQLQQGDAVLSFYGGDLLIE
jgi:16S rRNA (guanine966-N2)-methyltransferase